MDYAGMFLVVGGPSDGFYMYVVSYFCCFSHHIASVVACNITTMGRYSPTDGSTVAGVVVSVASVSIEISCMDVTWLIMSCQIHSCCSGEKTLLAAVDTTLNFSPVWSGDRDG